MAKKKNTEKSNISEKSDAKMNKQQKESVEESVAAEESVVMTEEADVEGVAEVQNSDISSEEKLKEFEDKYLRAEAEIQNIQRRAEKRIAEAHQLALRSFVPALGDVHDCLEKSLEATSGDGMKEGVALTLRKLKNVMDMHHISPIRPDIGVAFDPALHMAIGMSPPTKEAPVGTIAVVVQQGYMVNGRVVRAADVMVSQSPSEPPEKTQ